MRIIFAAVVGLLFFTYGALAQSTFVATPATNNVPGGSTNSTAWASINIGIHDNVVVIASGQSLATTNGGTETFTIQESPDNIIWYAPYGVTNTVQLTGTTNAGGTSAELLLDTKQGQFLRVSSVGASHGGSLTNPAVTIYLIR